MDTIYNLRHLSVGGKQILIRKYDEDYSESINTLGSGVENIATYCYDEFTGMSDGYRTFYLPDSEKIYTEKEDYINLITSDMLQNFLSSENSYVNIYNKFNFDKNGNLIIRVIDDDGLEKTVNITKSFYNFLSIGSLDNYDVDSLEKPIEPTELLNIETTIPTQLWLSNRKLQYSVSQDFARLRGILSYNDLEFDKAKYVTNNYVPVVSTIQPNVSRGIELKYNNKYNNVYGVVINFDSVERYSGNDYKEEGHFEDEDYTWEMEFPGYFRIRIYTNKGVNYNNEDYVFENVFIHLEKQEKYSTLPSGYLYFNWSLRTDEENTNVQLSSFNQMIKDTLENNYFEGNKNKMMILKVNYYDSQDSAALLYSEDYILPLKAGLIKKINPNPSIKEYYKAEIPDAAIIPHSLFTFGSEDEFNQKFIIQVREEEREVDEGVSSHEEEYGLMALDEDEEIIIDPDEEIATDDPKGDREPVLEKKNIPYYQNEIGEWVEITNDTILEFYVIGDMTNPNPLPPIISD